MYFRGERLFYWMEAQCRGGNQRFLIISWLSALIVLRLPSFLFLSFLLFFFVALWNVSVSGPGFGVN